MDVLSTIGAWLLCLIAAERTAELVVTSKFFAPFRNLIAKIAVWHLGTPRCVIIRRPFKFLSDLISCGWCTSAWTSLLFSMFLPGQKLLVGISYDNAVVKWFALFGLANLFHSCFELVHRGRVSAIDLKISITGEGNAPSSTADGTFDLSAMEVK